MAYNALERGRDLIETTVDASLSAIVAAVATEHGVTSPGAHREVYRNWVARPMYPHIEIGVPRGSLESLSRGEVGTVADYWVIASLSSSDPAALDKGCMVYLTSLIRLFSSSAFSVDPSGHYLAEPVEFDYSPPLFEDDTTQKRSVGVLVRFAFAEDV